MRPDENKQPDGYEATPADSDITGLTRMEKVPRHATFVFYILLVMIVLLTIVGLYVGVSTLGNWFGFSLLSVDYYTGIIISLAAVAIGFAAMIFTQWMVLLGFPLFQRKYARFLTLFLLFSIGLIIFFGVSIGGAILYYFILFFWTPRFIIHWSPSRQKIYRFGIIGAILVWMSVEVFLGSGIIGAVLLKPVALAPMIQFLLPLGLGIIGLSSLVVVIPLFVVIPRFWKLFYNARNRVQAFWMEYSRHWMGIAGVAIIAAFVLIGLLADILAPYTWGFSIPDISTYLLPPSPLHPLGTNQFGQDIYSRLLYGARISLLVGFSASLIAVGIGTSVGLIAGYFGGYIDIVLMRITDVFLSLPTLPLMLIFLVLLGQGLWNIIIVIAILGWTGTARMVRSETLSLRERPLTEAAHAIGASDIWIISRHILPNVLPLVLANMILGVVNAILAEAGITFLGFGDIFGMPSWGIVLHFASTQGALINGAWWWFVPPGVCILLTALGFAFASHAADRVVNPRLRRRRK